MGRAAGEFVEFHLLGMQRRLAVRDARLGLEAADNLEPAVGSDVRSPALGHDATGGRHGLVGLGFLEADAAISQEHGGLAGGVKADATAGEQGHLELLLAGADATELFGDLLKLTDRRGQGVTGALLVVGPDHGDRTKVEMEAFHGRRALSWR